MSKFILAYHNGGMKKPESPEEGAKMMGKWKAWVSSLGDAMVNPGTPLGKSKTVSSTAITDGGGPNPLSGYSILEALEKVTTKSRLPQLLTTNSCKHRYVEWFPVILIA